MIFKNISRFVLIVLLFVPFQSGIAQYNFAEVDRVLDSKQKVLGNNVCALILKDNKIVYTYQQGKYTPTTPELIASCSKWLTAALVMTFVDEGKLSVDDPVAKYLPEFASHSKNKILIRHCLSHTSGIKSEPITLSSLRSRKQFQTLADEVKSFAGEPMAGEPGTVFAYSNIGLNIAGRILEVIGQKDFETLFQERIARPLEMKSTSFTGRNAVNPSGSARSTASDYMNFLEMLLNNGFFHGKQILSKQSVYVMQQSQTSNANVLYAPEQAAGVEYGFGEWVHRKDRNGKSLIVSSPGLFGTYPYLNLSGNYAAIIFVKNLKIKNRKETYSAIQQEIETALQGYANNLNTKEKI